jgi:Arc/MetJ-type ribon-helix-helix transcriptional regulator
MSQNDNNDNDKPMDNITLNIPEIYDENIQYLKNLGLVSNRSEAIRKAVKDFLKKDFETLDLLKDNEVPS